LAEKDVEENMSNENEQGGKKPLTLGRGKLELKKPIEQASVRQSFSHGRSKTVQVEVRKQRHADGTPSASAPAPAAAPAEKPAAAAPAPTQVQPAAVVAPVAAPAAPAAQTASDKIPVRATPVKTAGRALKTLTEEERAARVRVLQEAARRAEEDKRRAEEEAKRRAEEDARRAEEEARLAAEEAVRKAKEEEERKKREAEEAVARAAAAAQAAKLAAETPKAEPRIANPAAPGGVVRTTEPPKVAVPTAPVGRAPVDDEEDEGPSRVAPKRGGTAPAPAAKRPVAPPAKRVDDKRRSGKMTVTQALDGDDKVRVRSVASMRRAREKERLRMQQRGPEKIVRDVIIPDVITVQELAARMAERAGEVIKTLMRMGVMATINQNIDGDTAELVVAEFGHSSKRASESDVLIGLGGGDDAAESLMPRAPVVTVMGHVDHGKTSLLDALRSTDVAAREAGGITQHIGAYQVTMESGQKITFIDTPGHEAFTEMRARGANVTDIVILVVAADDGIMPQTVEAIQHAKAANVPLVVAINKIDKPDANPDRVRNELLQHGLVVEELGGDIMAINVSAKARMNLDKLEEAILLQAEVLELTANPDRAAEGTVVEAKLDRGRGSVATVLVQRGTLRVGDIFVAGTEWGRVRALVNDRGESVKEAGPATPVEVLGLQGTPQAGDELVVVDSEARAREVAEYRSRVKRDAEVKRAARGTVQEMLSQIAAGEAKELPLVLKSDVQGSLEAISASLARLGTDEVQTRILFAGVGAVSESDITLARASNAMVVAFNVRANAQAREMARRDGVDIRYYSIIYNVIDDVKAALSGMLSPELRENFLGYAEIREVFNITKVGTVAGCFITEGIVKRGNKVRLLRDNVVIHEGTLKTLRRFKDEVREVKQGFECGMAFENYNDLKVGDVIEGFEMVEEARSL
jgi:translation initiation factor IF-2